MTSKLFEIITGILSLIMIVATTMNVEYLWYFFIGLIVNFLLLVYTIEHQSTNSEMVAMSIFSIIIIFLLWSLGGIGEHLIPNIFFAIMGCFVLFIIKKAWLHNIPESQ